jgi:hypothetical protein
LTWCSGLEQQLRDIQTYKAILTQLEVFTISPSEDDFGNRAFDTKTSWNDPKTLREDSAYFSGRAGTEAGIAI